MKEYILLILNDLFSSKEWIIALFSALLGSIVGAVGTYFVHRKHTKDLEEKQRLNLAKALSIEIASLWERYMNIAGKQIEEANDNKPILIDCPETYRNYFVIFDQSSNLVGLFNQDTLKKVIEGYINWKAFLDEMIEYGKMTTRYRNAQNSIQCASDLNNEIQEHFDIFRKRHFEIKRMSEETILMLGQIK